MIDAIRTFFSVNAWARWLAIILAAILGWEAVRRHLKEAGRKAERDAIAKKMAEEQARVEQTRRDITKGNQDAAQRADEAVRTLPEYRHTEQLRNDDPDAARVVLGTGARRGSGAAGD